MLGHFIRKQSSHATPTITTDALQNALNTVIDPVTNRSLPDAKLIERIDANTTPAIIVLAIESDTAAARSVLVNACKTAIKHALGIDAHVVLTAHRSAPPTHEAHNETLAAPRKKASWNLTPIDHVQRIIAVASGKGGVGKSTTTVMLAHALSARGLRVGIVDADIYGPSIPRMLGLEHARTPAIENNQMIPPISHGIKAMSMGLIMGDSAAVMRAPMITKALHQLLRGTCWGSADAPLDVLLVDMPPGTGDTHISLAQSVPLECAVIVTTPQDVAVMDAKKCAVAFEKLGVPLLGIVENMSGFTDSAGVVQRIFGEGGGRTLAEQLQCAFLAEIPLNPALCSAMEAGATVPECAANYAAIADAICAVKT